MKMSGGYIFGIGYIFIIIIIITLFGYKRRIQGHFLHFFASFFPVYEFSSLPLLLRLLLLLQTAPTTFSITSLSSSKSPSPLASSLLFPSFNSTITAPFSALFLLCCCWERTIVALRCDHHHRLHLFFLRSTATFSNLFHLISSLPQRQNCYELCKLTAAAIFP